MKSPAPTPTNVRASAARNRRASSRSLRRSSPRVGLLPLRNPSSGRFERRINPPAINPPAVAAAATPPVAAVPAAAVATSPSVSYFVLFLS